MSSVPFERLHIKSLPVRGAWIEIFKVSAPLAGVWVAPRKGSVD